MLIDSHCHLDAGEFAGDRDAVVARARAAGVGLIVVPAVEAAGFCGTAAMAARYPCCRVAYGIHPLYVGHADAERDLERVDAALAGGDAVAVGEIGLDHFVPEADPQRQEHFFVEQLKLARARDLPVLLHVRRAIDDVLKHLRRIAVPGGIAHAFNGSAQQAGQFIAMGFRLGFGGAMSYDGSRRIRELARTLPLGALVLETDAPDMPPAWAPRERNEPANLSRYAALMADLRGITRAEVIEATGANVRSALPRLAR